MQHLRTSGEHLAWGAPQLVFIGTMRTCLTGAQLPGLSSTSGLSLAQIYKCTVSGVDTKLLSGFDLETWLRLWYSWYALDTAQTGGPLIRTGNTPGPWGTSTSSGTCILDTQDGSLRYGRLQRVARGALGLAVLSADMFGHGEAARPGHHAGRERVFLCCNCGMSARWDARCRATTLSGEMSEGSRCPHACVKLSRWSDA